MSINEIKKKIKISIVVPLYNEEEVLFDFTQEIKTALKDYDHEIIFVDDGSKDNSLNIIEKLREKDDHIKIIQFSKNFGHQAAIVAGLRNITGNLAIVIDADLQDNPTYIKDMIERWEKGSKIVFTKRIKRSDTFLKKANAFIFYRLLKIFAPKTQPDSGDFYLIDKEIVKEIKFHKGKIFLRAFLKRIKCKSSEINVIRGKRAKGTTGYTYAKMIRLATDAFITSQVPIEKMNGKSPYTIKKTFGFYEKKVCIIGGGISGLALAYYLSSLEYKVTILEKSFEIGGLLRTVKTTTGQNIEKYYHHVFKEDAHLIELLKDLGIENNLKWHKNTTSLYKNNSFYPFTTPLELLKSPLYIFASARIGLATIYLKRIEPNKYKHVSARDLIVKFMGHKAWEDLWAPLFEGKFEGYSDKVGAPWFISRLNQRSTDLGYLDSSQQTLLDSLREELTKRGVEILTDQDVNIIKKEEDLFSVNDKHYDIIVSTINPKTFSKIARFTKEEKKRFSKIKYIGAICTLIELKKKQTNYYWNNILDKNVPFKGIIEHTNFIGSRKYDGNTLIYLSHYTNTDSKHFRMIKEELEREYMRHLEQIIPNIEKDVLDIKIFKAKEAQPIATTNFELLKNTTSIKNLYMTSMAHIYPGDRGVNFAIKEAAKIRDLIQSAN